PRMPARRILISNEGEGCPESLEVKFIQLSVAVYRRKSCSQKGYGAPSMTNAIGSRRDEASRLQKCKGKILDSIFAKRNLTSPWAGEVNRNQPQLQLKKIWKLHVHLAKLASSQLSASYLRSLFYPRRSQWRSSRYNRLVQHSLHRKSLIAR